jgi:cytochrome c553
MFPLNPAARLGAMLALVAGTPFGLTLPASAQAPDRQARTWAAACATCHTASANAAIPALSGRDAEAITRTLLEFKTGQRPAATVMHQHTKGYTDDELRRISQVLATQAAR